MESISIIIPTLNEEKYIGRLLDCLAKQTYKDFEVIIVDGQSDDNTKNVVLEYHNKLDQRIITSQKRGVAYQRNLGASNASHERLLFLDADVSFAEDFLEKSINEIIKKKASVVIPRYVPDDQRWYYRLFFGMINKLLWLMQKIKPCGIGICIFSHKTIHNKVNGFNENLDWTDDMDYIERIGNVSKFIIVPQGIIVSMRRFEKDGTKKTIKKWTQAYLNFLFKRTTKNNEIVYFEDN
jgi:glycosyltransferase involved in cell wall biosynthesis